VAAVTVKDKETETKVGSKAIPVKPIAVDEPVIDKGVLSLYILVVSFLGAALLYSLSLGEKYLTFSGSIVTALTTIAGFAVGVNAVPPEPPQKP